MKEKVICRYIAALFALLLLVFCAFLSACTDGNGSDKGSSGGSDTASESTGNSEETEDSSGTSSSGGEEEEPAEGEEADVVLFVGQSNMVGRETSRYTVDIPEGYAYEYKYLQDGLTAVQNPVGETFGEAEISSGSSIVPQFCADYVEQTGRKIVAVHVARGGKPISFFMQGGAFYSDMVEKYLACLERLAEEGIEAGRKFYVMYQGESDTVSCSKEDYKTRFIDFHEGVKEDLGMEFGALIYNGRNTALDVGGISRINRAKKELAEENEDVIVCDKESEVYCLPEYADMVRSGDEVHLNEKGLKRVASVSCENIVNDLGYGKDTSKRGVDPVTYLPELAFYPLMLQGASFSGGESAQSIKVGEGMPENIQFTVPDGKSLCGWQSADGETAWRDKEFVMPRSDMTLAPLFGESPSSLTGTTVTAGDGKLDFGTAYQNAPAVNVYGGVTAVREAAYTKIGDGYAPVYTIAKTSSSAEDQTGSGANFRILTHYMREAGTKFEVVYSFKNTGGQAVSFEIYLRSFGTDDSPIDAHKVELAAGETKEITIVWKNLYQGTDHNLLTYFRFVSPEDSIGAQFGVSARIHEENVEPEDPTGDVTLPEIPFESSIF